MSFWSMILRQMTLPSSPALLLIFGINYLYASAHFVGVGLSGITASFYLIMAGWIGMLLWKYLDRLRPLGWVDSLFFFFLLWVVTSLVIQGAGDIQRNGSYLLFMALIPFLCGRLLLSADLYVWLRLAFFAAGGVVLFALADRMFSVVSISYTRWPFFGLDHSPLLIGMAASFGLVALVSVIIDNKYKLLSRSSDVLILTLIIVFSVFMVWVMARGWLLASMTGVAIVILFGRDCSVWKRVMVLCLVVTSVVGSVLLLPKSDFYAQMLSPFSEVEVPEVFYGSILGEGSCLPFKLGVNSIEIRRVLYQEAIAITERFPWLGVGAGSFGEHSCSGKNGFPHSTILQVFVELGIGGGLLYLLMVGGVFFVFLSRALKRPDALSLWLLGVYVSIFLANQIYGNYFMDVNGCLLLGIAAGILAEKRRLVDA